MIQVTVEGDPVPWSRARLRYRSFYNKPSHVAYQELIRLRTREAMIGDMPILTGPVSLGLTFWLKIPKSWPKLKRLDALAGRVRPTGRPDLDNLCKIVADALSRGEAYHDDSQVAKLSAEKRYSLEPRLEINVMQL